MDPFVNRVFNIILIILSNFYSCLIFFFSSNVVTLVLGLKKELMFIITANEQENVEINLYDGV